MGHRRFKVNLYFRLRHYFKRTSPRITTGVCSILFGAAVAGLTLLCLGSFPYWSIGLLAGLSLVLLGMVIRSCVHLCYRLKIEKIPMARSVFAPGLPVKQDRFIKSGIQETSSKALSAQSTGLGFKWRINYIDAAFFEKNSPEPRADNKVHGVGKRIDWQRDMDFFEFGLDSDEPAKQSVPKTANLPWAAAAALISGSSSSCTV